MSAHSTGPDVAAAGSGEDVPDPVRRRVAREGVDGRTIEVLAARRGVPMRANPGGSGGTGGDSVLGFVLAFILSLIATIVVDIIIDTAAEGRPWKVKVYRVNRVFRRRIHSERLPAGVEPEPRMAQLLDEFAPPPTSDR